MAGLAFFLFSHVYDWSRDFWTWGRVPTGWRASSCDDIEHESGVFPFAPPPHSGKTHFMMFDFYSTKQGRVGGWSRASTATAAHTEVSADRFLRLVPRQALWDRQRHPCEGHVSGEITIRAVSQTKCQLSDESLLDQADRWESLYDSLSSLLPRLLLYPVCAYDDKNKSFIIIHFYPFGDMI